MVKRAAPADIEQAMRDLRAAVTTVERMMQTSDGDSVARLQAKLEEADRAYGELADRYLAETAVEDGARRRFAMVLAQLVNFDRLEARARPRSSPGQKIGALLDLVLYGSAYVIGLKRPIAAARLRDALTQHWPGLFAGIQQLRGRPLLRLSDDRFETAVYDDVSGGGDRTIPLRNLFVNRRTREMTRLLSARLLLAVEGNGPAMAVIVLNFFAGGGAETVALAYARAAAQDGGLVVVLITDHGTRRPLPELPPNVLILDFGPDEALDGEERQTLLYLLLQALNPRLIHVVNSEAAWLLMKRLPEDLSPPGRLLASIFALQFAQDGTPVGYAAAFLPALGSRLDALITDNHRFADEGPARVDAPVERSKIHVLLTPCRLEGQISEAQAERRLSGRLNRGSDRPLQVVWAGRLDPEKRIDILYETARRMKDRCFFRVFGGSVVGAHDWADRLAALPNVRMMGAYASPAVWDEDAPGEAFLFTSVWEGMPNTVVEAAWMGLPVVAVQVGGVGELIDSQTGWPVAPEAPASAYVAALDEIRNRRDEVQARTLALIHRVHTRHVLDRFETSVKNLYGHREIGGP